MSLLQLATVEQAAAKIGIFGKQGSGKTLTAMLLALGISKTYHGSAPIAMMDTETGSDFLIDCAKTENVPFLRFKSRAFKDMVTGLREAEGQRACVYLVDSYTHPWTELQDALKKKLGVSKLQFHHQDQLQSAWRAWTDQFLNSPCHVILCGRLGYEWDKVEDEETGKRDELLKVGTKLKGQGESGYEPSLLVEMEALQDEGARQKVSRMKKGTITHHAYVLKDRWRALNGRAFTFKDLNDYKAGDFQTVFKAFQPHLAKLAIGTGVVQHAVNSDRTSENLFDRNGDAASQQRLRRVTIALEEIQGLLVRLWPGQDQCSKELKAATVWTLFATRSWTRVGSLSLETLERALLILRAFEEKTTNGPDGEALTDAALATGLLEVCRQTVADEAAHAEATVGVL